MHLDNFMGCLIISSSRTLSLVVVVVNCVGNGLGDEVAGFVVDCFGAGV